jgi:hypothetical protein
MHAGEIILRYQHGQNVIFITRLYVHNILKYGNFYTIMFFNIFSEDRRQLSSHSTKDDIGITMLPHFLPFCLVPTFPTAGFLSYLFYHRRFRSPES